MSTPTVSIIMPNYNSQKYIVATLNSIIEQKFEKWELLITDDCSTDNSLEIIKKYSENDARIKYFSLEKNSGAAVARNNSIKKATGKILAFIDSDDIWHKDKLYKQLAFMEKNNYLFTSTSYEWMDEENKLLNNVIKSHKELNYEGVLKYCPGNSTVMYNVEKIGKVYSPDIKKRNDFVMWLQVIKKAKKLYGMDEVFTQYRVHDESLSRNKIKLIKYQWEVYRKHERLSLIFSLKLLIHKIHQIVRS